MNTFTKHPHGLENKTQAFLARQNHRMLIGGQWVDALENKRIEVENPAEETVIGSIPLAHPDDVNKAVSLRLFAHLCLLPAFLEA